MHASSPSMVLLRRIHKKVHSPEDAAAEATACSEKQCATPMPDYPFEQVTTWFSPDADVRETKSEIHICIDRKRREKHKHNNNNNKPHKYHKTFTYTPTQITCYYAQQNSNNNNTIVGGVVCCDLSQSCGTTVVCNN